MKLLNKITTFLKEVMLELKKVSWLSQDEVIKYTLIVIVFCLVVAFFLGGLDFIFSSLFNKYVF
ncbi:MAG: preprotein translocase subunit SecE [Patescibacteria group bacterium]|nr:preprotein translocase subunit SecE [Patescibacteria group bacterium]